MKNTLLLLITIFTISFLTNPLNGKFLEKESTKKSKKAKQESYLNFEEPLAYIDGPANVRWFDDKKILFNLENRVPINIILDQMYPFEEEPIYSPKYGMGKLNDIYSHKWKYIETFVLFEEKDITFKYPPENEHNGYISLKRGTNVLNENLQIIGEIKTDFLFLSDTPMGHANNCVTFEHKKLEINRRTYYKVPLFGLTHINNLVKNKKAKRKYDDIHKAIQAFSYIKEKNSMSNLYSFFRPNGGFIEKDYHSSTRHNKNIRGNEYLFVCESFGAFYFEPENQQLIKIDESSYLLKSRLSYIKWAYENDAWIIHEVSCHQP